jgi:hypothetical protein
MLKSVGDGPPEGGAPGRPGEETESVGCATSHDAASWSARLSARARPSRGHPIWRQPAARNPATNRGSA